MFKIGGAILGIGQVAEALKGSGVPLKGHKKLSKAAKATHAAAEISESVAETLEERQVDVEQGAEDGKAGRDTRVQPSTFATRVPKVIQVGLRLV